MPDLILQYNISCLIIPILLIKTFLYVHKTVEGERGNSHIEKKFIITNAWSILFCGIIFCDLYCTRKYKNTNNKNSNISSQV